MFKKISIILIVALSLSFGAVDSPTDSDISIVASAMDKALVTQVRYETMELQREEQVKDLQNKVGALELEGLIKDFFIVLIAVVKVSM